MSLVKLIDRAVEFVRADPDRQMTRSELNDFGALAEGIYVEALQAGIQGALPRVSELGPQLQPLPELPLPPVQYETKLNLPGDWGPAGDDEPNDSRAPMPEPPSLFPADGEDAEPVPCLQVFRACATQRWFEDMGTLRRLAETIPVSPSTSPVEPEPTIWYHGERSYSIDGRNPFLVTAEQDFVLTRFLEKGCALQTADLQGETANVSAVMKSLHKKFGDAVRLPGKSKAGYYARVRSTPK